MWAQKLAEREHTRAENNREDRKHKHVRKIKRHRKSSFCRIRLLNIPAITTEDVSP
jgi:hypothetical protein